MTKYKKSNYREINLDQVKQIMQEDFKHFPEVLDNVFCSNCIVTTIKDYLIYLDALGNIILQGICSKCGKKVARFIETGDNPKKAKRAKKIYGKL